MTTTQRQLGEIVGRARQLAELRSLDILRSVPDPELDLLLGCAVFRAAGPGTTLINEGSSLGHCYIVLHGTLWATLHDRSGREVSLGLLGRGDCCGEGGLFGHHVRRMTVRSETTSYLLQLRHVDLLKLFPRAPGLAIALRRAYRLRLVQTTLGRVPILSQLSLPVRQSLVARLSEMRAERGAEIIRQGEPGDALYMIELGQVAVEQEGGVIAQLADGDFFGEISLLRCQPHNATVRALTPSELLVLPADDFRRLVEEQPELRREVQHIVDARIEEAAAVRSNEDRAAEIEVVIQHGLMRGRQLLARDPRLCPPGCRACEEACSTRFGQPRLHLNGVAVGSLDIPSACRQCQFGAECVDACPEHAINWDVGGVLLIDDRCNGCGACVPACPYDAIQLVSPDRPPTSWAASASNLLLGLWQRLYEPGAQQQTVLLADKCDLCYDHQDRACVAQCPTGAMQLIPVDSLFR